MGTVTFLFTDIEGSTRMWSTHPDEMRAALARHDELMAGVVSGQQGRIFKHTGDGVAAVFASAQDAVAAAVEIQRGLNELEVPGIGSFRARVGLHSGEADERGDDYFGIAVNRAARIMDAGHGGQILASAVTVELAGGGFESRDLGAHRLADLAQPEKIFQILAPGVLSDHPRLRTLDRVAHNLPVFASSFVGRELEHARLAGLVRDSRLVTVTGVGGSGKTRLSLHVAAELVGEHSDGVWLVELAPVSDPDRIDDAILSALGARRVDQERSRDAVVDHLRDKELLLVVDNCEHLIDAVASLVEDALAHAPSVSVLATSRELLGVPGEVSYGLRSMTVPTVDADLDSVRGSDAVLLFTERAAAARPGFEVDANSRDAVIEICRRLDGMPLAIELAAARIRSFGPAQIAEHLDQRFRLLTGGARTAVPRQQTLMATIEWSFRLLSDTERALFTRLSVFQGGFTFEAVAAVCSGDPVDELDVLELLPALVDKSLVIADSGEDGDRYRLLETLRQFARDRLDDTGQGDEWRHRHALFYAEISGSATTESLNGPKGDDTRSRIKAEADNIRQAVTWAIGAGVGEVAADAMYGLGRIITFEGAWSEVTARYEEILALDLPAHKRARALASLGIALVFSPDRRHSPDVLSEAAEAYRQLEDSGATPAQLADFPRTLLQLGYAHFVLGEDEHNERYTEATEEGLEVARRLNDQVIEAVALSGLAHHRDPRGDPDVARHRFAEAEVVARRTGIIDPASFAGQRAFFEFDQGNWEDAERYFATAVAAAGDVGLAEMEIYHHAVRALLGRDGGVAEFRQAVSRFYTDPETRSGAHGLQTCLAFGAGIDAAAGRNERAAVAQGASQTIEPVAGAIRWDVRRLMEEAVEEARSALGPEAFGQASDRGQSMTVEDVIDFVASGD